MKNRKFQTINILLGIILVVVIAASGGLVYFIWQGFQVTQRAVQPVSELTHGLATQVSQLLHPTPTVLPDPVTIIHEVRSLARLETIQYSVEKVITAESGQGPFGFLFGDRLLLVAHGVVIAGLDLEKLGAEDISIKNGVVYIRLPEPEIFITSLDNELSYIYDRDTGVLTKGDINLETTARRAAENEIEKSAIEDGILAQARVNGESFLARLVLQLGYEDIIFVEE
jgi:hypothetical protein